MRVRAHGPGEDAVSERTSGRTATTRRAGTAPRGDTVGSLARHGPVKRCATRRSEMPCPRLSGCPLFPKMSMKSSLRVWQCFYCEGTAFERCERFKLASSGGTVPPTLLPNGKLLDPDALG